MVEFCVSLGLLRFTVWPVYRGLAGGALGVCCVLLCGLFIEAFLGEPWGSAAFYSLARLPRPSWGSPGASAARGGASPLGT